MNISQIAALIQAGIFILILSMTLLYSISILIVYNYRRRNNILILNICLTTKVTCIYFIVYFILYTYNQELLFSENTCHLLLYAYNISSVGIPFSFITITINRFFSIVYPTKHVFKTKQWLRICIVIQWIAEFIISLPFVLRKGQYCTGVSLLSIYTWTVAVFLPLLIYITLNSYIFLHVRSSSRRITPHIEHIPTFNSRRQLPRNNRRNIRLLLHIMVMFFLFIIGWGPVYTISCLRLIVNFHPLVFPLSIIIGELCLTGIIIDLFMYNHDLRHHLWNKLKRYFERS